MKRKHLINGQIINKHGISYVSDLPSIYNGRRYRRFCIFKCFCGKEFNCTMDDAINKRTSCGCKKGNKKKEYKTGDLINGIKFIKSCGTVNYSQRAIFECPLCGKEWESLVGNIYSGHTKSCCGVKRGWSKSQWMKLSNKSTFYKVKVYNDNECFIKIGITSKTIKHRLKYLPYEYETIKVIEGKSGYIFDLENRFKRLFKKYRYNPLINFKGETECYKIN